jgi:rhomboid protease GluP
MAVGFTPKHIEEFPLNDLTQHQSLVLVNEVATKLNWKVAYISDTGLIAYTDNGMFSWNAEIKIKIDNGVISVQSASTGNEMMDWGKNKKTVASFIATFEEEKLSLPEEELDTKYQQLKEQLVAQEEDILKLPPATTTENIKGFFSIFIPSPGFFITPILVDLNILIFILMAMSGANIMLPDNASLLNWGANFRPMTLNGEWWRLITNCFVHIGIFHLLMNMYALIYIGVLLEPHLGKTRFSIAYLLSGITASLASLSWHDLTISAGASGAIFGLYGVFLAMLTTDLIEKTARKALLTSIAIFVGYNLMNGLKGGIDNAAHIGGLLSGLVIGYALIPSLKKPDQYKLKFGTLGLLTVLILTLSFFVYKKTPNDIITYDTKMKEFVSMEAKALAVYELPQDTPSDKILYEIKDHGIGYWEKNIVLIDGFEKMNLPIEIRMRNTLLKEYCELRITTYELMYKTISENTDKYQKEIDAFNRQIEAKIKELAGEEDVK